MQTNSIQKLSHRLSKQIVRDGLTAMRQRNSYYARQLYLLSFPEFLMCLNLSCKKTLHASNFLFLYCKLFV
jgi:hypothetical protein